LKDTGDCVTIWLLRIGANAEEKGKTMKVAIMTDTNSGLGFAEAKAMGVYLLSMPVIIDSECYFEGKNLTEAYFFQCQEEGRDVMTSQPSPGDVLDMWEQIFADGYDQLVFLPMSSGLSSSCQTAKGLAAEYEGRVFVADNHRISVTLIEAVKSALQLAEEGLDGEAIMHRLEADSYQATIYITVNTLKYLKKSGRVTAAGAALGDALHVKPVLTIQGGKLDAYTKTLGMKKARRIMEDAVKKDILERFGKKPEDLILYLAGAGLTQKERDAYIQDVSMDFPGCHILYYPLSLSVCAHTGRGALGVAASLC
jgi:DegV family protein with EDD domain